MLHNVDCTLCDLSLDLKAKNNYMLQFTEQQSHHHHHHLFSFRRSVQDYKIQMDMEIITF